MTDLTPSEMNEEAMFEKVRQDAIAHLKNARGFHIFYVDGIGDCGGVYGTTGLNSTEKLGFKSYMDFVIESSTLEMQDKAEPEELS